MDFKKITTSVEPQHYKFPYTTLKIASIVSSTPKDINITPTEANKQYFQYFIQQVNEWLRWFDKFFSIFTHIIEWLKNWNVDGAVQLFNDIHTARSSSSITVIEVKRLVERTLKFLQSFNDLRRLCNLFNCSISFQLIDAGTLNRQIASENYIRELKRFQPHNSFTVAPKSIYMHDVPINDRQYVHWCIACERFPCNLEIEYRTTDYNKILFDRENVAIDKNILQGEFETQSAAQLIIRVKHERSTAACVIWYRITQTPLSTSHLFHGIFSMFYQKYFSQPTRAVKEGGLSQLLDRVFGFIDSLLDGNVSLRDITDLKAIFCDKNINVKEEVKKLFTNRSSEEGANRHHSTLVVPVTRIPSDKEIEQVCEWLQVYQYYSHISIIIHCIETFDILPIDNDDELIGRLRHLRDENCSLKEITHTYEIVKQQFQNLSSQHLQLIKTAVECSSVVRTMKKSDLYSSHGRRRFQELRDNLTTQFQFQERNNMILNSWIIVYALCEPFVLKANSFNEFVRRIAELSNFEENSLRHMQSKTVICSID